MNTPHSYACITNINIIHPIRPDSRVYINPSPSPKTFILNSHPIQIQSLRASPFSYIYIYSLRSRKRARLCFNTSLDHHTIYN